MLLSSVKNIVRKKMERYFALPEDTVLEEMVYEALLFVASKCEPQVLLRFSDGSEESVFRGLTKGFFITYPEKIDFSEETRSLQIDETLTYAVINMTCYFLSGDSEFNDFANQWINVFRINDLNAYGGEEIETDD